MNKTAQSVLLGAWMGVGVLILLVSSGLATSSVMGPGTWGQEIMSWIWLPTVLIMTVGLLIGWTRWAKRV